MESSRCRQGRGFAGNVNRKNEQREWLVQPFIDVLIDSRIHTINPCLTLLDLVIRHVQNVSIVLKFLFDNPADCSLHRSIEDRELLVSRRRG